MSEMSQSGVGTVIGVSSSACDPTSDNLLVRGCGGEAVGWKIQQILAASFSRMIL